MNVWRPHLALAAIFALVHCAPAADAVRGATSPIFTYEAELANTNGAVLGPDYTGHTAAREASGRQCVSLATTGQFLEFKAKADAQGLVVRYSIPDSSDGHGTDATLSLYINGKPRAKLAMTSRYAYLYGDYPFSNDPSRGTPRHFWDELRLMPGTIHRGDVIRLQKDADDAAPQYLIDFVDLEQVAAPLERPANSLSITEFGATPNDSSDARPAFLAAIAAAKQQHKSVWIPPGQFVIQGSIDVNDVAIRGAGMWYSTLVGAGDYAPGSRVAINGNGSNITLSDFAIIGKLNYRSDSERNDGLGGSFGTGSIIRNIWVEHTKTGAWFVNSNGLRVEGCRFRNTIADGINLCLGMRNTIVRNCSARGNGDDCFAMWPATYEKSRYAAGHNSFINCTAQLPFLAQGFSIYGGDSNAVKNCQAIDIPYGAGLFASTTFPTVSGFEGTTIYSQITILRAGDTNGAIGIVTDRTNLAGVHFKDIDVDDSPTDGIKFISLKGHLLSDATFHRIRIVNPGLSGAGCGIVAAHGAAGSATLVDVSVLHPKTIGWQNNASAFNLIRGSGNVGVDDFSHSGAKYSLAQERVVGP
jgi:hypothetical protein